MESYEVNSRTCALIALNDGKTEIIEEHRNFIIDICVNKILHESCEYYGSTLEGRIKGSQKQLGMAYKLPIIIEETKELIFFPTISAYRDDCSWISLKHIKDYKRDINNVIVSFHGGKLHKIPISYESFDNQIFRATKLLIIMRNRRNM